MISKLDEKQLVKKMQANLSLYLDESIEFEQLYRFYCIYCADGFSLDSLDLECFWSLFDLLYPGFLEKFFLYYRKEEKYEKR